jgi:hypothetical protein
VLWIKIATAMRKTVGVELQKPQAEESWRNAQLVGAAAGIPKNKLSEQYICIALIVYLFSVILVTKNNLFSKF